MDSADNRTEYREKGKPLERAGRKATGPAMMGSGVANADLDVEAHSFVERMGFFIKGATESFFRKPRPKLIINADTPDLCQEIEQFLSDGNIQIENIPVTIIVNPPIKTVIEDVNRLSEVLVELLTAYRSQGDYFLKLHKASPGIIVVFGIAHAASAFASEMGHC